MTSNKSRAGRLSWDLEPSSGAGPAGPALDADLETEVAAIAASFAALPPGLQAFLDREARTGSALYTWS